MYIIPLFTDHTAQVLFIIAIKNPHYNLVFQVFGVHTTRSMWLVELSTISIHDDQKTKKFWLLAGVRVDKENEIVFIFLKDVRTRGSLAGHAT